MATVGPYIRHPSQFAVGLQPRSTESAGHPGYRRGWRRQAARENTNSEEDFYAEVVKHFANRDKTRTMPNKAGLCVWLQISGDTYNEYKKRFSETLTKGN
jgi:hypothetical protein